MTGIPDMETVAQLYLDRSRPKVAVTPKIQAQADDITHGIEDRRAQAEAIYRWVSKNLRVAGVAFGAQPFVPRAVDDIAASGIASSRDYVALLRALLAARQIVAAPVFVNNGGLYGVPAIAIMPGAFDHMIAYLPEFDLYADPTLGVGAFGVLSPTEQGKPALLTADARGRAGMVTLPVSSLGGDTVETTTTLAIDRNGNAEGASRVRQTGLYDYVTRELFRKVQKGTEEQIGALILKVMGFSGTGRYAYGDPLDLSEPFDLSSTFTLTDLISPDRAGGLKVRSILGAPNDVAAAFGGIALPTRTQPILFPNGHREETTSITFPDSVRIVALPKPAIVETPFARYESRYGQEGGTVVVTRSLDVHLSTPIIMPADYPALRMMGEAVMRDLNAQILYQ